MRNVTEIQRELIRLGYLAPKDENGKPNDDGKFGLKSLAAFNRFLASKGTGPVSNVSLTELNALPFPAPTPPPKPPSAFDEIGAVFQIINLLKSLKGNPMDSTKPWYTSQTIWANVIGLIALALGFFHVGFTPADQATAISAIIDVVGAVGVVYGIVMRLIASHKLT